MPSQMLETLLSALNAIQAMPFECPASMKAEVSKVLGDLPSAAQDQMKTGSPLTIKALKYERTAAAVLASLLEPPAPAAVRRAVDELVALGALDVGAVAGARFSAEALTPLGAHLAALPCDARIGKFLLLGAVFGALDETLTIAATLTSRVKPCLSKLTEDADHDVRFFASQALQGF